MLAARDLDTVRAAICLTHLVAEGREIIRDEFHRLGVVVHDENMGRVSAARYKVDLRECMKKLLAPHRLAEDRRRTKADAMRQVTREAKDDDRDAGGAGTLSAREATRYPSFIRDLQS